MRVSVVCVAALLLASVPWQTSALSPVVGPRAPAAISVAGSEAAEDRPVSGGSAAVKAAGGALGHGPAAAAAAAAAAAPLERRQAYAVASLLGCLLVLAVAPILPREGPKPFAVVLLYLLSLVAVQPMVKQALQLGYPHPYSLTTLHMLLTAVVASVVERPRLSDARQVLPLAILSGLTLVLGNSALAFGTAAFVTMVGAWAPASTLLLLTLADSQKPTNASWTSGFPGPWSSLWRSSSSRSLAAVLLVCTGAALCIRSEVAFSSTALLLAVLSNMCRSCRTVWQHRLLQATISPFGTVAWTGTLSVLLLGPAALRLEGLDAITDLGRLDLTTAMLVAGSAVAGTALNIAQCLIIQYLGPLEQTLLGNLQILGVLLLSTVWLGETVMAAQWLGAAMIISGCTLARPSASGKALRQEPRANAETAQSPEPATMADPEQGSK